MGGDANRGWSAFDGAPPAALRAGGGYALTASVAYRSLLTGAIDYAGLFPPASLTMADAVAEYALHREAPDEWALGRFVVPLGKWAELGKAVASLGPRDLPWPVSVLGAPSDAGVIGHLLTGPASFRVQSIECKVDRGHDIASLATLPSRGCDVFVEASRLADFDALAPSIASIGASGKIRTGGVTHEAFPASRDVLAFLRACRANGIRFKATAGLHHALRGEYRLTYEPSPPTGVMFGFLNVAVAAAMLWFDADDITVLAALEESSADAFEFNDAGITWGRHQLTVAQLNEVRSEFFTGFGSCSFREPMAEIGLEPVPHP